MSGRIRRNTQGVDRASEIIANLAYISRYFVPLKSEYRTWCESKGIMSKAFIPECRAEQKNATAPKKETGARFALPLGTCWADVAIKVSHLRLTVDVAGKRHCFVNVTDIPKFVDGRQKGMTPSPLWNIFEGWVDQRTVVATPKNASEIRLALNNLFSMTENPVVPLGGKRYIIIFTLTKTQE